MKILRTILHPWVIISLFFIILITGESIGGVYLFYLLLGIPHGLTHSILGFTGVILLLMGYYKINNKKLLRKTLLILGTICMCLSLYYFFHNDRQSYNHGSFKTAAFWTTFLLFVISALIFIVIDNPKREHNT
ncbi:MAG: hypothetical protein BGP13_08505 [Sphingobacteriales bacterium 40-81]|nr:MAG: hypothetical protein BGP13_08505 [Sphingobacteriales bacterium 40-81]